MTNNKRDRFANLPDISAEQALSQLEPCSCQPLSLLSQKEGQADWAENEQIVPVHQELAAHLRNILATRLPNLEPVSLFLLHISQWERASLVPHASLSSQRRRYHAPASLLEQVMANERRVMRADDRVLMQENGGVANLIPDVDQQGAQRIVERVYQSISLLQAETVIPPLTLDTSILLGMGTYPESGPSLEQLLYHTGQTARRITLRPALTTHLWDIQSLLKREKETEGTNKGLPGFPFMHLPKTVPQRLKHFIPHPLAVELRCVPVGRNAHSLTVAMADPTNNETLMCLQTTTGMTIFPVSCDLEELYTLLSKKW